MKLHISSECFPLYLEMGRDVTGLRVASALKPKPSPHSVLRSNQPNALEESPEAKVSPVNAGSADVGSDENGKRKQDDVITKSPNLEEVKCNVKSSQVEETNPSTPVKPESGLSVVDNEETKHVVEKPLELSGEQHVYVSPKQSESPVSGTKLSPNVNKAASPGSSKKSQPHSPFSSRKHMDEEDNWSMTSSTAASVRTTRGKTTVAVAPKFCVDDRLEKRKEFYTKLEEKHKALEAEKHEYDSRSKEEQEAAIKQLRKTMVFKANPVPNFYYEGPPPKKELKKLPTTRAVSPKLGRRKSFGDAATPTQEKARSFRHSLGSSNSKEGSSASTPSSTRKKKVLPTRVEQSASKSGSLKKVRPKKEASPQPPPVDTVSENMSEQQAS